MRIKAFLLVFSIFFFVFKTYSQACDETLLKTYQIRAKDTDDNISFEINKHFAYIGSTTNFVGTIVELIYLIIFLNIK